jgi:hypothetical protein
MYTDPMSFWLAQLLGQNLPIWYMNTESDSAMSQIHVAI